MAADSTYTVGVEEEYFVFNARTRRVISRRDERFIARVTERLGNRVTPEMLQCQMEAITPPCASMAEVRRHLVECRSVLAEEAGRCGLGIAALGTFPLALWREQRQTPKPRYDALMNDLQMLGARNMMCGMHVHVELPDPDRRVTVMQRVTPYLPLLLALSTSSPFWEGHPSGLSGYRLAAYDELPRTGLPELLRTAAEYDEFIGALVGAGVIPDASHVWWALRPSPKYPTLELRVADVCTCIDDALAIAALYRCMTRAFDREPAGPSFDRIGRAITAENKWRAQRYGIKTTFVDPFRRTAIEAAEWLNEIVHRLAPDIEALGCRDDIARLAEIARDGSSADRQMQVYRAAKADRKGRLAALKEVVDWAAAETVRCEDAVVAAPRTARA
jgi:carboxylate-amine ligase